MFIPLCCRDMYILYCWCIHEDYLFYPSLYLWRITSWSKMCFFCCRNRISGCFCLTCLRGTTVPQQEFSEFLMFRNPLFRGLISDHWFHPGWCLGDLFLGRRNTDPQFVVRDFFICSYFLDPFFTNQSNDMSRATGFDHCSSGDRDSRSGWTMILRGSWLASCVCGGGRSKSYPQKMAIIWGLFDIWSWCPD